MWAKLPLAAQEELWSNVNSLVSSVVKRLATSCRSRAAIAGREAATFRATSSDGYSWLTADDYSWLTAAVQIKPRNANDEADGPPEMRWLLIPREDFQSVDDW